MSVSVSVTDAERRLVHDRFEVTLGEEAAALIAATAALVVALVT